MAREKNQLSSENTSSPKPEVPRLILKSCPKGQDNSSSLVFDPPSMCIYTQTCTRVPCTRVPHTHAAPNMVRNVVLVTITTWDVPLHHQCAFMGDNDRKWKDHAQSWLTPGLYPRFVPRQLQVLGQASSSSSGWNVQFLFSQLQKPVSICPIVHRGTVGTEDDTVPGAQNSSHHYCCPSLSQGKLASTGAQAPAVQMPSLAFSKLNALLCLSLPTFPTATNTTPDKQEVPNKCWPLLVTFAVC